MKSILYLYFAYFLAFAKCDDLLVIKNTIDYNKLTSIKMYSGCLIGYKTTIQNLIIPGSKDLLWTGGKCQPMLLRKSLLTGGRQHMDSSYGGRMSGIVATIIIQRFLVGLHQR